MSCGSHGFFSTGLSVAPSQSNLQSSLLEILFGLRKEKEEDDVHLANSDGKRAQAVQRESDMSAAGPSRDSLDSLGSATGGEAAGTPGELDRNRCVLIIQAGLRMRVPGTAPLSVSALLIDVLCLRLFCKGRHQSWAAG